MVTRNEISDETSIKNKRTKELSVQEIEENSWAIRPCFLYEDEYKDCTSMKARFHQYFIHGESVDCQPWKRDYDNCRKYEKNPSDLKSAAEIIESEERRRNERMKAHYDNTTWNKRKSPPPDWNKPLPDWLIEKNKNSYLQIKADELQQGGFSEERTLCSIM